MDAPDPFEPRWHESPRVRRATTLVALCAVTALAGHFAARIVFAPAGAPGVRSPVAVERNASGGCPPGYDLRPSFAGMTCCQAGAACD